MRVDGHVHLIPDDYRAELEARDLLPFPLPAADVAGLEALMERHAIDAAVVSLSPPGVSFGDRGLARDLARMVNETLAALVATAPGRYAALAILPLPSVDDALAELAYALDVLGMDGVLLLSNTEGVYPGDPSLAPLLEELDRRRCHVLLHPHAPPHALPLSHPIWLYEYPFETTRAVVDLIWSGALERCPAVTWQLSHLGGTAPFLAHRIASLAAREPAAAAAAPEGALAHLARLYYDTALSDNAVALAATRLVAPVEHVLFGSDWPYAALPPSGDPQPGLDALGPDRPGVDGAQLLALLPGLTARIDAAGAVATSVARSRRRS